MFLEFFYCFANKTDFFFKMLLCITVMPAMSGIEKAHRDNSINTYRKNMYCHSTAYTRSFNMGLTSAEGEKLECFK
jgi:hypothetical protein